MATVACSICKKRMPFERLSKHRAKNHPGATRKRKPIKKNGGFENLQVRESTANFCPHCGGRL